MNRAIQECFYNAITKSYDTSYFIAFHHVVAWMIIMPERRRGHYTWRASQISLRHYNNVIMGAIASQITSLMIVFSAFYSVADQRKHQSSASLAFVPGTCGFTAQMVSDAENVSIWWRHHVTSHFRRCTQHTSFHSVTYFRNWMMAPHQRCKGVI